MCTNPKVTALKDSGFASYVTSGNNYKWYIYLKIISDFLANHMLTVSAIKFFQLQHHFSSCILFHYLDLMELIQVFYSRVFLFFPFFNHFHNRKSKMSSFIVVCLFVDIWKALFKIHSQNRSYYIRGYAWMFFILNIINV